MATQIARDSRMRTRFGAAFVLLITACSSDESATGLLLIQGSEVSDLADAADCSCFWAAYEYPSEQACVSDNIAPLTAAEELCVLDVGALYPRFEELTACRLSVEGQRYDCYTDHAETCDPAGFDACDAAYDAAYPCADAEPCHMLTGTKKADCDLDRAQLFADVGDCFGF